MKKMSDFNIPPGKMSDYVSFPLFGFTLVIKLRISILKAIKIFYLLIKNKVRFDYILSNSV